jgi:hypothetical protein
MSAAFLSEKFRSAAFEPRTESFVVEQLVEFFPDGNPTFTVRGLTAAELQRANDASSRQSGVEGVVKAIATQKDQVEQIRKALGLTYDTPGETVKRIEMLVQGSVSPVLTHADAVKIAEVCPIEFFQITNAISLLTGRGSELVKPTAVSQTNPA